MRKDVNIQNTYMLVFFKTSSSEGSRINESDGKLVTRNKHFGPAPKINENNSNNQQEQTKKETKKQSAEVSSS